MTGRKCPSCGGRHGTAADVRSCMAAAIRKKNRDRFRDAFDL